MSDYVHNKVVRLPFPKEILSKCDADDAWDCEPYLQNLLGSLWNTSGKGFKIQITDDKTYIDWVYYSSYGEESGDYGFARMLTQKELDVIKPYFNKLGVDYKDEDLRVVDYCYYNCCEPTDYYRVDEIDDSNLFIG